MRVLMVSQELPPETGWGGIGTYVATLAPALADAGAEVRVLSVVRGQERSDQERDGVVVHRRPLRRPPGVGRVTRLGEAWERVSLALAVDREVRALDFVPDVIEAPEWRAEGLVLCSRPTPVVVRLHSAAQQLYPWVSLSNIDARLSIALERRSILNASLVISTRSNLEELARSLGPRLPATRAIPLPVAEIAAAQETAVAQATPAGPRVTFVGRLEARKGPDLLLSAVPGVLSVMPEARFTFIGADTGRAPGSFLALLRERAESEGVSHAVDFAGHRPRTEVLDTLRASSVCAFPSRWESFGYGAAEAAALGKAVVASQIPAFVDLFGETGAAVLVPSEDTDALTRAILELLRAPERARAIGEAARRRIAETFAPARIAAATLEAYEEARSSSSRRGRRHRLAAVAPAAPVGASSTERP